ncbi:MAG: hypothetical protein Kow0092_17600 [Deferrisomatales bacterium]
MHRLAAAMLVLAPLLLPPSAPAQSAFVTERFEITLRSGPGLNFKILEMLPSGTALERLEDKEGWTRVRTPQGTEGWVVSRYVTPEPPKGPRLAAAQEELERLKAERQTLVRELEETRRKAVQAENRAERLSSELAEIRSRFDTWKESHKDVIAIRERAEGLEAEQASTRQELDRLRAENENLKAREKFYWFFSGVVVLSLGWVLGYVYASSRHRARSQARFRF